MRACENDGVAVRVAQPAFPVGILAAMPRFEDVRLHLFGPGHGRVEIGQFEPQENTISIGSKFGISKWTVMVLDSPIVQLEDQLSVRDESLIIRPTVVAAATKEALIPATTCLNVMDANERL